MSLYYLQPRDPLVVRDGRPNSGRSESGTLRFPYPGTVAGLVRTRMGASTSGAFELHGHLDELRRVAVKGPLLVRKADRTVFVPAPRDALLLRKPEGPLLLRRLHPIDLPEGAQVDAELETQPVGLEQQEVVPGKPPRIAPAWWPWSTTERWLLESNQVEAPYLMSEGLAHLPGTSPSSSRPAAGTRPSTGSFASAGRTTSSSSGRSSVGRPSVRPAPAGSRDASWRPPSSPSISVRLPVSSLMTWRWLASRPCSSSPLPGCSTCSTIP